MEAVECSPLDSLSRSGTHTAHTHSPFPPSFLPSSCCCCLCGLIFCFYHDEKNNEAKNDPLHAVCYGPRSASKIFLRKSFSSPFFVFLFSFFLLLLWSWVLLATSQFCISIVPANGLIPLSSYSSQLGHSTQHTVNSSREQAYAGLVQSAGNIQDSITS